MLKNILKKSLVDISTSFMIILICFIFAAFFPHFMNYTPAQRLFFYDLLVRFILGLSIIAVLGIILHHFIMKTDLLSIKKSVRQAISVLVVVLLTIFVNLSVFSVIPINYTFAGVVFIMLLGIAGMVVGFIIEEKMQKKDIEEINKRLSEIKEEQ